MADSTPPISDRASSFSRLQLIADALDIPPEVFLKITDDSASNLAGGNVHAGAMADELMAAFLAIENDRMKQILVAFAKILSAGR